ncbi:MAG: hypothetical protein ACRDTC_16580 [Pseudonocardiaceae bacterium]
MNKILTSVSQGHRGYGPFRRLRGANGEDLRQPVIDDTLHLFPAHLQGLLVDRAIVREIYRTLLTNLTNLKSLSPAT